MTTDGGGETTGDAGPSTDGGGTEAGATAPAGIPDPGTTTVHEAIRRIPGAREVFLRFGIDGCCGGELPVAEAASLHEVQLERLLEALEEAGGAG